MEVDMKKCTAEGCDKESVRRGLCDKHSARFYRHGDASRLIRNRVSLFERLLSYSVKFGSCWLWTSSIDRGGYGRLSWRGRLHGAHRLSYRFFRGHIDATMELDHLCKTRHCINPYHLEPVTHAENVRRGDAWKISLRSHCSNGHELSVDNLSFRSINKKWRICKECMRGYTKKYRERKELMA